MGVQVSGRPNRQKWVSGTVPVCMTRSPQLSDENHVGLRCRRRRGSRGQGTTTTRTSLSFQVTEHLLANNWEFAFGLEGAATSARVEAL